MNVTIAEIFKGFVSGLNFSDVVGGLVKPITTTQLDEDTITVPADYSLTQHQVSKNNYKNYIPDAKKRSIVYFEDVSEEVIDHQSRYINMSSIIKLVAWFNLDRINTDLNNAETLMLLLMGAIPKSFPNQSNILKVRISLDSVDIKSPDIFSAYDYDEPESQFLLHPYDYGALNYNILFSVKPDCLDQIVIKTADCLTSPNC